MKNHLQTHRTKITIHFLKSAAVACVSLCLLTACGQRGSLYLPTAPEAAERSTIVDTITKPAPETRPAPAK